MLSIIVLLPRNLIPFSFSHSVKILFQTLKNIVNVKIWFPHWFLWKDESILINFSIYLTVPSCTNLPLVISPIWIHLIIWKLFKQNHREFVRYSRALITVCPQYSGYVNSMLLFAAPKQQIFMFSWWRTDRTATTSNQLTLFRRGKSKLYVTLVQGKTNLIPWETFACWASIKKFYHHKWLLIRIEEKFNNRKYRIDSFIRTAFHFFYLFAVVEHLYRCVCVRDTVYNSIMD